MSELAKKLIAENIAKHERGEDASYLDLGNCGLIEVPDLSGMDWLETLIVSNRWWNREQRMWIESRNSGYKNRIAHPSVHVLPNSIKRLTFGGDWSDKWPISDFSFLEKSTNLTSLDISRNEIRDARFLEKMTNLTSLDISRNEIREVQFLEKMTNLTSLYISLNQINDFSFLENLTNLNALDIRSNQISDARFLEKMIHLNALDISDNKISDTRFLEKMTNLTSLDISFRAY